MSFSRSLRPRATIQRRPRLVMNGVRRTRTYRFFRCLQCAQIIRFAFSDPSNILCPFCYDHLGLEFELPNSRPRPETIVDTMASLLDPPSVSSLDHHPQHHQHHQGAQKSSDSDSAYNLLPVRVTQAALSTGADASTCPVCKDDFALGEEIRETPCKHWYHEQCILPWLRINSTCPVCRFELSDRHTPAGYPPEDSGNRGGGIDSLHFEDLMDMSMEWSWNWVQIFSAWPFRPIINWVYREDDDDDGGGDRYSVNGRASRAVSAWLRSLFIL